MPRACRAALLRIHCGIVTVWLRHSSANVFSYWRRDLRRLLTCDVRLPGAIFNFRWVIRWCRVQRRQGGFRPSHVISAGWSVSYDPGNRSHLPDLPSTCHVHGAVGDPTDATIKLSLASLVGNLKGNMTEPTILFLPHWNNLTTISWSVSVKPAKGSVLKSEYSSAKLSTKRRYLLVCSSSHLWWWRW